jgi:hypothetical protein
MVFSLLHPAVSLLVILAVYCNVYLVKKRKIGAHTKLGRVVASVFLPGYVFGILGMLELEEKLFSTPHSYTGSLLVILLLSGVYYGFRVLGGERELLSTHRRLMILIALLLILQLLGGVANLQKLLP